MSGKAYTMKEMKSIVQYLTEHNAYGEIKGRKMWMDFADSKVTNRTWQSLKETFLKRILPDIHNPYYKLTMHQISSFRQGYDVEKRLKQTLEIREASEETAEKEEKKNHDITDNKDDEGENHKNPKVDSDVRDSTETLVLDTCYETPEEIQRDLTSPVEKEKNSPTKKLRDLIEFEPTTSEVQKLIEEFGTEDEGSDREPQMEIDLGDNEKNSENVEGLRISISDSEENNVTNTNADGIQNSKKSPDICPNENKVSVVTEEEINVTYTDTVAKENHNLEKEDIVISNTETTKTDEVANKTKDILNTTDTNTPIQSSITDSLLPNNQEELKKTNKPSSLSLKKYADKVGDKKTPQKEDKNISPSIENPCLKSVSLYDEQFSNKKSIDTENRNEISKKINSPPPAAAETTEVTTNDVLILKSHTDTISSDSDDRSSPMPRPRNAQRVRDKALANVFGFTSGAVHRRRRSNYRKQSISHRGAADASLGSSEWTSDTGSEYVSPPRGRRNRQTRKYLKPKSGRVLSLEKNGGLFVINNNKIYPLVKDGRIVKNYLTYISDNDSEEEKRHWKQKYLEEKKKTAQLEGLLHQMKYKEVDRAAEPPACAAACSAPGDARDAHAVRDTSNRREEVRSSREVVEDEKPVKIKFTKNNEEVQLEGPWSNLNPVLAQVMQLFQREPELTARPQRSPRPRPPPEASSQPQPQPRPEPTSVPEVDVISDSSTPVIVMPVPDEIKEKIDKIENEIFKEIEEQEKQENSERQKLDENVTTRNTRTRKSSTKKETSKPPPKKPRIDQKNDTLEKQDIKRSSAEVETDASVRQTRRQSKITSADKDNKSVTNTNTRRTSKRLHVSAEPQQNNTQETGDDDVRYKFPSLETSPAEKKALTDRLSKKTQQKKFNRYAASSATSLAPNYQCSTECMQGYQSLDVSPTIICANQSLEQNISSSTCNNKNENQFTPNKLFHSIDDGTNDCSNSYQAGPLPTLTFHNSTISTELYRTDSYQLLMHQSVQESDRKKIINIEVRHIKKSDKNGSNINLRSREERDTLKPNVEDTDGYSSSHVSLPTSPVLSIVENISLNKSYLSSVDDMTVNEFNEQGIYATKQIMLNDLMKSDPDVPMPLMEQECKIEAGCEDGNNYHYNINSPNTLTPSQNLITKLCTVNIEDIALSDSFSVKFRDLLLDSNKKTKGKVQKDSVQKNKGKKRSSTPRKRQTSRNVKQINKEPSIEEQMEIYSCAARRSCPHVLKINDFTEEININYNKITDKDKSSKIKNRKKKDIIKVKITKPKEKVNVANNIARCNNTNVETDGKNDSESGVFLHDTNNSIDFVHNHSETCLQAHECVGDSVEFVENSNPIITIDSNSETLKKQKPITLLNINCDLAQDMYNSDAQDGTEINRDLECMYPLEIDCATLFHTPMTSLSSATSLITEDLSIETPEETLPKNTNWYLFSEDENTNTNCVDRNQNSLKGRSYGAYLNEIFPITCAIPDLSTITEQSKENDIESRSTSNSPFCK